MNWQKPILTDYVRSEWVDYNKHMNDAAYARVFSLAIDAWMIKIGLNEEFREKEQYTLYTLETHLLYVLEMHEHEKFTVDAQLIDHDEKRIHIFCRLFNKDGVLSATSEQMLMGIDQSIGRPATFPAGIAHTIDDFALYSAGIDIPKEVGRVIGIKK